jgi:hypothetical protein
VFVRVLPLLQAIVYVDIRICRTSGGASIFWADEIIKYLLIWIIREIVTLPSFPVATRTSVAVCSHIVRSDAGGQTPYKGKGKDYPRTDYEGAEGE